jgi:hypothetical protein
MLEERYIEQSEKEFIFHSGESKIWLKYIF